ncbi:ABC transporter substrate-binding protein [Pelagibacterium luteolum]|uniref:Peptide/nickel transport system substrate-binding protein n=1 Tax=Pelagibacterium luteolum TaxID=440168 RepID=A0A1G7W0Q4_9HYPH|nr:ABC transporter substrate-binding protein [Pelagibacterium luteolum]SDG65438.1 peptide/nickel transport system substrate-binding protein [Pelagibacterium luteolum]
MSFGAKASLAISTALILALSGPALAQRTDVVVGLVLEPPHLDPTSNAAAAIDEVVYANVFEGLTRFGPNGDILPALAESWDVAEDGLTYRFMLHDGVTFHDGSAMTADDVVFSLDRARADDSVNAQKFLFADIAEVTAEDDTTVVVTLDQPNGNFLFNMAWGDAVIVAPESAETNTTDPVGTGPFRFADWRQGDSVTIERNPDYWGEPVQLERATFRFIADPTAAFAAMMAEDVDTFPVYPAPETLSILDADPRFEAIVGTTEGETILAMNNRREPLDDVRVREAIVHAIDRQEIIDGAMFGYGTPIGTHFAPHHPAYVDLLDLSAHDPQRSRELLAEAGVEGLTLSLALPPPVYARRGGEIIAAQLRAVGIETEIVNVEWAQWLEQVFGNGDFDLTVISHTEPLDIEIYGRDDYYFGYAAPSFLAIWDELNETLDPDARNALLGDLQRDIAENYVNVYLFQLAKAGVQNVDLEGMWVNAPTQATDLTGAYWAR